VTCEKTKDVIKKILTLFAQCANAKSGSFIPPEALGGRSAEGRGDDVQIRPWDKDWNFAEGEGLKP
jgi:hypothetical protein